MNTISPTRNIPVARPSIGEEEEQAVLNSLRSGWVSQGPKVAEFEDNFAAYVGARNAVAVTSCTVALHLALVASGIRAGDEVICPSLSFIATANAIAYAGAIPVFADIDPATYNIDPECIERAITARTRAILVVHQVGLPAALDEINAIASRRGLALVEDAACAVGAEYHGQRIGRPHSAIACFSFHPRKVLTTGEGGMITTSDDEVAARMRRLRQHGMSISDLARHDSRAPIIESYDEVGFNYRMTDMQAALGIVQLRRLDEMLQKRRQRALRYTERLTALSWIIPPREPTGLRHTYQSYMLLVRGDAPLSRDELMKKLMDRGISTRRGVMAIHREAPYRAQWDGLLPNTNVAADAGLILPLYQDMTDEEQDWVCGSLEEIGSNTGT